MSSTMIKISMIGLATNPGTAVEPTCVIVINSSKTILRITFASSAYLRGQSSLYGTTSTFTTIFTILNPIIA